MYEEIDRSGQSKWNVPIIFGFIVMIGIVLLRFQSGIIGANLLETPDLQLLFGFGPMAAYFLGSLFGALRKRTVKVNVDRIEFEDQSRNHKEFGKIYYEGDFKTGELSGSPPHICGWFLLLIMTPFIGWIPLFMVPVTIDSFFLPAFVLVLMAVMFPISVWLGTLIAPIRSKLVKNPLHFRITKYLDKSNVLHNLDRCEIVDSIIIRFRYGHGQDLSAIDDVRIIVMLSTEPQLEVEMTLEDMEDFGPEYTFYHASSLGTTGESEEKIGKHTILVTHGEAGGRFFIRMRYKMNRVRVKWALGTDSELCQLLCALQEQIQSHVPHALVPKVSDDAEEITSIEGAFD